MEFSESLKKNSEFRKVYRQGRSVANRQLVMYVLQNQTEGNRLGISVSKKVGNSVVRHRVTRLVREAYRLKEHCFLRGYDVVVIGRIGAAACSEQDIEASLLHLARLHHLLEETHEES